MRIPALLVGLAAVAALAGCGSSRPVAAPAAPSPLLGLVGGPRTVLARIQSQTLRPFGRRIDVGSEGCASRAGGEACWAAAPWSYSPDGARLVVARNQESLAQSLRIVDVAPMRVAADIPLDGDAVGLVAWPRPERLLAVQARCCQERDELLVFDVAARRLTAARSLGGTVLRAARSSQGLVLLLAPARRVGPARLAVIDRDGDVRFVTLARIRAGEQLLDARRFRLGQSIPGLAVAGRRALVVAPGFIADVDLASLAVSYHELTRQVSLLGRLRDWLEPAAYAKAVSGPVRTATWLGGGLLAVAGGDEHGEAHVRPAGLSLVDTRRWSVRTIDADATDVRVAGGLLLATGQTGLAAYERDGSRRYRRFADRQAWVDAVLGDRVYVDVMRPGLSGDRYAVMDLAGGRVLRSGAAAPPRLLLRRASGWWDDG